MNWTKRTIFLLLAIGLIGAAAAAITLQKTTPPPPVVHAIAPDTALLPYTLAIKRGDNFDDLLRRAGVEQGTRLEMIDGLAGPVDVRTFRAWRTLTLKLAGRGHIDAGADRD